MTNRAVPRSFSAARPAQPESSLEQRHMDLAASIQAVTEEVVLRIGRHVQARTGMKHLVLAGGVALNCVANGRLLREGVFDDLWIQPAAGDAGGALGAALFVWHQLLEKPRAPARSDTPAGQLSSVPVTPPSRSAGFWRGRGCRASDSRRSRPARTCRRTPGGRQESSAGFRGAWSLALGRWGPAAFWAIPGRRRCRPP